MFSSLKSTCIQVTPRENVIVEQTLAQMHLWLLHGLYPNSTWQLMPFGLRLRGCLQFEALKATLMALQDRREPTGCNLP